MKTYTDRLLSIMFRMKIWKKGINGKSLKTDLQIIESAMKSNPGYDACCGLYGH